MKKIKTLTICSLLLACFALAFFGCPDYIQNKPSPEKQIDLPDGYGAVRISINFGSARTAMPQPVFDIIELTIIGDGTGEVFYEETVSLEDTVTILLEPGRYLLNVKAYIDYEYEPRLVAEGSNEIAIEDGDVVSGEITLQPIEFYDEDDGPRYGTLIVSLDYPENSIVSTDANEYINILLYLNYFYEDDGVEDRNLMRDIADGTATGEFNQTTGTLTLNEAPSGYHIITVRLTNSSGDTAFAQKVVHIYPFMTTTVDFTFNDEDFQSNEYIVYDSGDQASDPAPGTLRHALEISNASRIRIVLPESRNVIQLVASLEITKSVTILGNGVTITQDSTPSHRLLEINDASATVTISRVRFEGGEETMPSSGDEGGAIYIETGTVTLESCIFSNNQASYGGAIYNKGTLNVRGCTFYNNRAGVGQAIYNNDNPGEEGVLNLDGNLFYGNKDGSTGSALTVSGFLTDITTSFNVVDEYVSFGSLWSGGTDNKEIYNLPFSTKSFRLLSDEADNVKIITADPGGYPKYDFYGKEIVYPNAAAGAVQGVALGSFLDVQVNDDKRGSVLVEGGDENGCYYGENAILTAYPNEDDDYDFSHWLINDSEVKHGKTLNLTMDSHKKVEAVFGNVIEVINPGDNIGSPFTPGTLRSVIGSAEPGDIIRFNVQAGGGQTWDGTIELESEIYINESITIDGGGGVTLKRVTDTLSSFRFFSVGGSFVRFVNLCFEKGEANNGPYDSSGGAIYIGFGVNVTIESCIFNENKAGGYGGAIAMQEGILDIKGCTFYKNNAAGGGAIYSNTQVRLTITGNLFFGNEDTDLSDGNYLPNVITNTDGQISKGYNVVDANEADSGWVWNNDSEYAGNDPLDTYFAPNSGFITNFRITSPPAGFPTTDFYGNPRTNWAPGAVDGPK
ncbi:MAG: hypothetical protein FWG99_11935 [Treponema sp.]|nr:hypothetical protein [Treponema sp.]